jgi:hypothetical protein
VDFSIPDTYSSRDHGRFCLGRPSQDPTHQRSLTFREGSEKAPPPPTRNSKYITIVHSQPHEQIRRRYFRRLFDPPCAFYLTDACSKNGPCPLACDLQGESRHAQPHLLATLPHENHDSRLVRLRCYFVILLQKPTIEVLSS